MRRRRFQHNSLIRTRKTLPRGLQVPTVGFKSVERASKRERLHEGQDIKKFIGSYFEMHKHGGEHPPRCNSRDGSASLGAIESHTRTKPPTPPPRAHVNPGENLNLLELRQTSHSQLPTYRPPMSSLRLDHYEMDIDPRLRDASSAGSYTQPPHASSAPSQIAIAPLPSRAPSAPQQYQPVQSGSPQIYYLPQTPQSGGNATDNDAGNGANDGEGDGGPGDPKRSRACEACRGLKVKCEPDPNNPDLPCKRCAKANRNCVVTQPSRKRQKKTDSRVAELEKKIDALTATLAQKTGSTIAHNDGGDVEVIAYISTVYFGQNIP